MPAAAGMVAGMARAGEYSADFVPHAVGEPLSDVEANLASSRRSNRRRLQLLYVTLAVQAVCAFFFLGELWTEILGLRKQPIPYAYQELIQILASFGLVIGVVVGSFLVRNNLKRVEELNRQIDLATGNYKSHLQDLFDAWRLSPSEQEVTIYAMKGFSNGEIAEYRSTAATTVKSQMNSVYRKSGLANRQQLISFLVEELLSGVLTDPSAIHVNRGKMEAQAA
jgi:DNA-binding CsgD family transcriptional regulator